MPPCPTASRRRGELGATNADLLTNDARVKMEIESAFNRVNVCVRHSNVRAHSSVIASRRVKVLYKAIKYRMLIGILQKIL